MLFFLDQFPILYKSFCRSSSIPQINRKKTKEAVLAFKKTLTRVTTLLQKIIPDTKQLLWLCGLKNSVCLCAREQQEK